MERKEGEGLGGAEAKRKGDTKANKQAQDSSSSHSGTHSRLAAAAAVQGAAAKAAQRDHHPARLSRACPEAQDRGVARKEECDERHVVGRGSLQGVCSEKVLPGGASTREEEEQRCEDSIMAASALCLFRIFGEKKGVARLECGCRAVDSEGVFGEKVLFPPSVSPRSPACCWRDTAKCEDVAATKEIPPRYTCASAAAARHRVDAKGGERWAGQDTRSSVQRRERQGESSGAHSSGGKRVAWPKEGRKEALRHECTTSCAKDRAECDPVQRNQEGQRSDREGENGNEKGDSCHQAAAVFPPSSYSKYRAWRLHVCFSVILGSLCPTVVESSEEETRAAPTKGEEGAGRCGEGEGEEEAHRGEDETAGRKGRERGRVGVGEGEKKKEAGATPTPAFTYCKVEGGQRRRGRRRRDGRRRGRRAAWSVSICTIFGGKKRSGGGQRCGWKWVGERSVEKWGRRCSAQPPSSSPFISSQALPPYRVRLFSSSALIRRRDRGGYSYAIAPCPVSTQARACPALRRCSCGWLTATVTEEAPQEGRRRSRGEAAKTAQSSCRGEAARWMEWCEVQPEGENQGRDGGWLGEAVRGLPWWQRCSAWCSSDGGRGRGAWRPLPSLPPHHERVGRSG
mmetsp:Transcript_40423/g.104798  ORF Transcript_40423/g.104798 Transcript_40423/m.104798 type:complete len:626 (+) Transcript_40423:3855-5732(+)